MGPVFLPYPFMRILEISMPQNLALLEAANTKPLTSLWAESSLFIPVHPATHCPRGSEGVEAKGWGWKGLVWAWALMAVCIWSWQYFEAFHLSNWMKQLMQKQGKEKENVSVRLHTSMVFRTQAIYMWLRVHRGLGKNPTVKLFHLPDHRVSLCVSRCSLPFHLLPPLFPLFLPHLSVIHRHTHTHTRTHTHTHTHTQPWRTDIRS